MNIAVREALKLDDFDCFIFHDVSLFPRLSLLLLKSCLYCVTYVYML